MKSLLSVITDTIFCFFITFVLSLIFLTYFFPTNTAIIFSALISSLLTLLVAKCLIDKRKSSTLKRSEQREKDIALTQLNFLPKHHVIKHFLFVLEKKGYTVFYKKGRIYFKDKPIVIEPCFGFSPVEKNHLVNLFNSLRHDDVGYVLAQSFSLEVQKFCALFKKKIVLIDGDKIYKFLKEEKSLLPEKYTFLEQKVKGFSLFSNLLKKKKAKKYLFFGLIFLFMSYFVSIKGYYLFFACAFLISALAMRLFGKAEDSIN